MREDSTITNEVPIGDLQVPVSAQDHVQGPASAPVTLVEYADYECPYSGRAYHVIKGVQRELGDQLRLVYRNFLLREIHAHAEHAAEAAEGAANQGKFWLPRRHDGSGFLWTGHSSSPRRPIGQAKTGRFPGVCTCGKWYLASMDRSTRDVRDERGRQLAPRWAMV